jgi:hypothetical protein
MCIPAPIRILCLEETIGGRIIRILNTTSSIN